MTDVVVVDYGAGNLVSVRRALEVAGASPRFATEGDALAGADLVVVPGVGASAPAMARLRRRGLERAIVDRVASGAWYLGICLGLQLLFDASDEDGARTLGDDLGAEDPRYGFVELGQALAPAFRALPKREQTILRLRFIEDLTQSEIAEQVGVSQMHVSRLLRRSLDRLNAAAEGHVQPQV